MTSGRVCNSGGSCVVLGRVYGHGEGCVSGCVTNGRVYDSGDCTVSGRVCGSEEGCVSPRRVCDSGNGVCLRGGCVTPRRGV